MNKVVEFKILENYNIWLKFNDGFSGVLNLRPFIGKGFTKELLDCDKFKTLSIEPGGGLVWPNGFDFCPNYLRQLSEDKIVQL